MRDIYDVMNVISPDSGEGEYSEIEFSDVEAARCVRRLKARCKQADRHARRRFFETHAAACIVGGVAGIAAISGGVAYAKSSGILEWLFHEESSVPEEYVDSDYVQQTYANPVSVETTAQTVLQFDVQKAAVSGNEIDLVVCVTYPDFDAETYDASYRLGETILLCGGQEMESVGATLRQGEENGLESNQILYDLHYTIPDGMAVSGGDTATLRLEGLKGETTDPAYNTDNNPDYYSETVLIEDAEWELQLVLQDAQDALVCDCSGSEAIVSVTVSVREICVTAIGCYATEEPSVTEPLQLEMRDGSTLGESGRIFNYGMEQYDPETNQKTFRYIMTTPIDLEQVEAVIFDGERFAVE